MPGAPGTHITLTSQSTTTFTAGAKMRWDLTQLASLQGPPPLKHYVRSFVMNVDQSLVQSTGTEAFVWQRAYNILASIVLQMQGHVFVNLPFTGGHALRLMNFIMFGRKPEFNTNVSFSSGAAQVINTKFVIPCYDPRAINPEEDCLPVGILTGAYLEATWSTSTIYNGTATWTISTTLSSVRSVTAEIIARDEVRFPALWTIEERRQSGVSDFITPEGVMYTDIAMIVIPSAGADIVADTLTASQITNIILTSSNGRKTHDNLTGGDICALYNTQQGLSSEGYTGNFEGKNGNGAGAGTDFIPLQWLPRSSGKKTHLQPDLSKPYLQVTGSVSVSAAGGFELLLKYYKPTGARTVADLAAKSNTPLPAGYAQSPRKFLVAKSASKQPVAASKSSFIAQKLNT